jgi:hypothetical protein
MPSLEWRRVLPEPSTLRTAAAIATKKVVQTVKEKKCLKLEKPEFCP